MGRRYVEPTLAAFVGEQVEGLNDPRDLTEIHVYHEGRFICRALSPGHAGSPSLREIQRARRGVKERDKQTPATTEASDADQQDILPGPSPTGVSGSTPLTTEFPVEQPFLKTREHVRFIEFAKPAPATAISACATAGPA